MEIFVFWGCPKCGATSFVVIDDTDDMQKAHNKKLLEAHKLISHSCNSSRI